MAEFTSRDGVIPGLFKALCALMPEEDPRNRRCVDGYYVTEDDLIMRISHGGAVFHRLGRDVDGSRCWVGAQYLMDNWYEGPYYELLPLPVASIEELLGLSRIEKEYAVQPKPEHAKEDDSFFKAPFSAAYREKVLEGARAELACWQAQNPGSYANKTGTEVGELNAIRRVGQWVRTTGDVFGEFGHQWTVVSPGGCPATYCLIISLIASLELGWSPEVFLVEEPQGEAPNSSWDVPAIREFLELTRMAYDRAVFPLRRFVRDGEGSGDYWSAQYFRDLDTGKRWRWKRSWTTYYSDGITIHRPEEIR